MAIPYKGEMFMGDPVETTPDTVYLQFRIGSTDLPYVSGTAIVFTGTFDEIDGFIPDGKCWPSDDAVPPSGLVGNGPLALAGSATHARIYARVACDLWEPE